MLITAIIVVFVVGYLAIAFEHQIHINKAASALLVGVICWTIYAMNTDQLVPSDSLDSHVREEFAKETGIEEGAEEESELKRFLVVHHQFLPQTGEIAFILFFLIGAMTIVEVVDANEGFVVITDRITSKSKVTLLWIVSWLTFFFSAVLDNLTTTIVMISLLRKLIGDRETRLFFAGIVVVAANAGGAWTVIGDVTTTMLWIGGKIETVPVMIQLFVSSAVCLLVPLAFISFLLRGELERPMTTLEDNHAKNIKPNHRILFLVLGVVGLLSVPIFKTVTHLPPYAGMMLALGAIWMASEIVHADSDELTRSSTGVLSALQRVDMTSVLFFLGILLAVGALGHIGILRNLANQLDTSISQMSLVKSASDYINSQEIVAVIIGFVSAIVDNVPLVAAGMKMYDEPINDPFWMLLAYCAGTGGSCLIIGSAAGVAAMGMEKINFVWYLKRIAPWAALGYIAGVLVFLIQSRM